MIPVLSKPLDQIGPGDIKELIDSEVPEGEQIEFKEALSTRDGSPDRWVTHGDGIGERARNEILEEAVAFANAYGGALLLGVGESEAKPPVAARISPVPRCTDLAERLKLVFRDCVEPQIPRVEIFAVPTEEDGGGAIIIRTGRSRMAPHRVKPTRKCPIRRSDRCEEMTMREIQDLTLNISRGMERLERQLAMRSERFAEEFQCLESPDCAYGIRLTAAPIGDDIQFDRVFRQGRLAEELNEPWRRIVHRRGGNEHSLEDGVTEPSHWRPMLRAARAELVANPDGTKNYNTYQEIHEDGVIELGNVSMPMEIRGNNTLYLPLDWLVIALANLAVRANRVRIQALTPTVEYAIEIEILAMGGNVLVDNFSYLERGFYSTVLGVLRRGPTKLPRYILGDTESIPEVIDLLQRDMYNLLGKEYDTDSITIITRKRNR